MMNDRARLWSKRKSAPFADPRDEERALREMRKSIDHSFNFNIDFKGEQPYMDNYRATVSFGAGCWQNTGTRRRADVPQQQERQHSILVSRQGLHSGLAMLVVAVCLFVMGVFWLNLQSQIQHPDWCPDDEHQREAAGERHPAGANQRCDEGTVAFAAGAEAGDEGRQECAGGGTVRRAGCYLRPAGGRTEHHDHHGRGAADAYAVIESTIHSNKLQKRESGGRTCIRNCWYASESG